MRAVQFHSLGGPEVLQLLEIPTPIPEPHEQLIAVAKAGVNFADLLRIAGRHGTKVLPQTIGAEIVGRVVGTNERVVALLPNGGACAQFVVAEKALSFAIPNDVPDEAALALFEQGLTAYFVLQHCARLLPGESVAIHAAAGGVGSLAIQIAAAMSAGRIIAIASSEKKRALARELGAHVAIDGKADGLTERLIDANHGQPIDVVLEMVGGAVFSASQASLAPFGRIVVYGSASDEAQQIDMDRLQESNIAVVGFWIAPLLRSQKARLAAALDSVFDLWRHGQIKPMIGGTYALKNAVQAYQQLAARESFGKLIIDPTLP